MSTTELEDAKQLEILTDSAVPVVSGSTVFSIADARRIVEPCFAREPHVYWVDLLVTAAIAYGFASAYLRAPVFSLEQSIYLLISGFALYRAGCFIHEVAHVGDEMPWFRATWNVLCGIPMLMPSFFLESHVDHHKTDHYGTERDGQYLPLGCSPGYRILLLLAQVPLLPVCIFVRFLLSPLTFVHPRVRNWFLEHASSFVINFRHRLTIPPSAPRRVWAALELACFVRAVVMLAVVVAGVYAPTRLVEIYVLAVLVVGLNYNRSLVAHHYRNRGDEMTPEQQLEDSVTIKGFGPVTALFLPLGLRYHALHHMLPTLPYHNLAWAHWRLMQQLPPESPYHATVYRSCWHVLAELWADAREAGAASGAGESPRGPQSVGLGRM
ncbi:MAG TPA: fatty acid desaturase [Pirellulales bacterium]|jgi:fatty acid desaturase|nr:fatty acid desaturase [Pirellulales bacterium]